MTGPEWPRHALVAAAPDTGSGGVRGLCGARAGRLFSLMTSVDGRVGRAGDLGPAGRMDRRRFLRAAGAAWGAGWLGACGGAGRRRADGRTAGQFAGAGAGALDPPLDRVGLQLYTVRSLMADDVAGALGAVAGIGYDEVEFAGYFGHRPSEIRGWLDGAGLAAPAAHVGLEGLAGAGLETSAEAAAVVGHRWLVLPWIGDDMRTPDGYRELAELLNSAGAAVAQADLRVAYHNHAFEFDALDADGVTGYALLLERLDPAFVDLEIDFHWSAVGGADGAALLGEHPGRFALCHVKDLTADGRIADVGAGEIDWGEIFGLAGAAGLRHFFVEHDRPGDPLASVEASYRYLSAT
ncbi:MAG: TIM barrel protein [Gemmatimonadota bacterium]|nr:TIM barrel protein [Gemmatimonadota bacterium]